MPLPLGHAAIGLTTYEVCSKSESVFHRWKVILFVVILANLPDIDVILGLLFRGNGSAFHRGPTHSLFFALLMGFVASIAWKCWSQIPRLGFGKCFLLTFSHVVADLFLTASEVSLFWPFEVNWTTGYCGWGDIVGTVFLQAFQDIGIIIGCIVIMIIKQLVRKSSRRWNPYWPFYRPAFDISSIRLIGRRKR
ncbi:MAG: metal-dependent hydrolase [Deltaproteobacteria bacterium]|nr:metal-dependent hydrolase [Deltaproteobacteria bacterium]